MKIKPARLISAVIPLLLMVWFSKDTFANQIDQQYDPSTILGPTGCLVAGCSVTNISSDSSGAQTFTAGQSGRLLGIELFLGSFSGTVPLNVSIASAPGGIPSNNSSGLLADTVLPLSMIPATFPGGWVAVDFSQLNVHLESESVYAIVLSKNSFDGTSVAWWGSATDPYSGGNFYSKLAFGPNAGQWVEPNINTGEHIDLGFRTIIAVSEPSTVLLLSTGILALILALNRPRLNV